MKPNYLLITNKYIIAQVMLIHDIGICSGGILVPFGQRYTDFGQI